MIRLQPCMHFIHHVIEGLSLTLNSIVPILAFSVRWKLIYLFNLTVLFCFSFLRAQLLDYKVALNLTTYLKVEEDFLPWQRVISAITYIISMFEDDKELYPVIEVINGISYESKCLVISRIGKFLREQTPGRQEHIFLAK